MCDEDADGGEVVLAKLSPQAFVEARDAVVGVGGGLAVGDAVEEVAVVGAFGPHAFHFVRTWLEVAKVLFAEAGLFVDFDFATAERAWACRGRRGVCLVLVMVITAVVVVLVVGLGGQRR